MTWILSSLFCICIISFTIVLPEKHEGLLGTPGGLGVGIFITLFNKTSTITNGTKSATINAVVVIAIISAGGKKNPAIQEVIIIDDSNSLETNSLYNKLKKYNYSVNNLDA